MYMAGMRRVVVLAVVLAGSGAVASQSEPASDWDRLRFLEGKWVGEGSSELGKGSGSFTFEPDLRGKVLVRRNHSEYPATKDRPKYVHDDLMIVYSEPATHETRAFYCDTEGHIIHYGVSVSSEGRAVTLLSDRTDGGPRFRLGYVQIAPGHLSIKLEQAEADSFHTIVEGRVRKVP